MKRYLSVKQTSKILGYSTNTVYKFINEGKIKSARLNNRGRFRVSRSSIEDFLGYKLTEKDLKSKPSTTLPATDLPKTSFPKQKTSLVIRLGLIGLLLLVIFELFTNPVLTPVNLAIRGFMLGTFIYLLYYHLLQKA